MFWSDFLLPMVYYFYNKMVKITLSFLVAFILTLTKIHFWIWICIISNLNYIKTKWLILEKYNLEGLWENVNTRTKTLKKKLKKCKNIFYAYNDIQFRFGDVLDNRSDVVEIYVGRNGHCRYSTVQNWSDNIINLVT